MAKEKDGNLRVIFVLSDKEIISWRTFKKVSTAEKFARALLWGSNNFRIEQYIKSDKSWNPI